MAICLVRTVLFKLRDVLGLAFRMWQNQALIDTLFDLKMYTINIYSSLVNLVLVREGTAESLKGKGKFMTWMLEIFHSILMNDLG